MSQYPARDYLIVGKDFAIPSRIASDHSARGLNTSANDAANAGRGDCCFPFSSARYPRLSSSFLFPGGRSSRRGKQMPA
jgi:hypothetical protein